MQNYQYIYLALAIIIWTAGYLHNGKLVRPKWKVPGKFLFYVGVSVALTFWIGHFTLVFMIGHPLIGLIFHTKICRNHDINWWTCEPKEKYLAVQEKWAKGDFSRQN